MKGLANYNNITIRISKLRTLQRNNNNNKSYLFIVKSDELPGCAAHGLTISEALSNFQKMAELWLKWFDDSRSKQWQINQEWATGYFLLKSRPTCLKHTN
jgi:hypothetical protein